MSVNVNIEHRLGEFDLAAKFKTTGGLTALYGESGAGKSTIVNAIAGLITPRRGLISIANTVVFDSQKRINIPSHKRRIGYVFQDARLFPHLSVKQNLFYGKWFAKHSQQSDGDKIINLLGLAELLHRMPNNLSGGEKQRVAIGRALLSSPQLLLMDEPLASLDDARKTEIMPYIVKLRDVTGVPIIYVSHAAAEITALASQVVLIAKGKTIATGTPADILPNAGTIKMTIKSYNHKTETTTLQGPQGDVTLKGHFGEIGQAVEIAIKVRVTT